MSVTSTDPLPSTSAEQSWSQSHWARISSVLDIDVAVTIYIAGYAITLDDDRTTDITAGIAVTVPGEHTQPALIGGRVRKTDRRGPLGAQIA